MDRFNRRQNLTRIFLFFAEVGFGVSCKLSSEDLEKWQTKTLLEHFKPTKKKKTFSLMFSTLNTFFFYFSPVQQNNFFYYMSYKRPFIGSDVLSAQSLFMIMTSLHEKSEIIHVQASVNIKF